MFSPLVTILIAISLVLGGGSLTVVGAQSSQPDQPLYAVKLLSEDARLQLASTTQTALQLQLEFADRRAAEIATMFQNGKVPSQPVQDRYQTQLEQTMRQAVGMPDPQAVQALEQVRFRLQNQQHAFLQLNPNASLQAEAALLRLQQMILLHLQWVEEGLADPARMRLQLHQQKGPLGGGNGGRAYPPSMGMTPVPGNPGMGGGMMTNPWLTGTPVPGSHYDGGMMGNPWTTGTPTPYSGYGPGPGPMPTGTMGAGTGGGMGPGPMPTSGMGGGRMRP